MAEPTVGGEGPKCILLGSPWQDWRGMGVPGHRCDSPGLPASICLGLAATRDGDMPIQVAKNKSQHNL